MDRRRALSQRPAEEIQCWSHAVNTLTSFRDKYEDSTTKETLGRVNRLISGWQTTDGGEHPLDGYDTFKTVSKRLTAGLTDVKAHAEAEAKAIDEALEAISVVIALRKADAAIPPEKRTKRNRGSSPASMPTTPAMTPVNRVTLSVNKSDHDRSSEGPSVPANVKKDVKNKGRFYSRQFPLQTGRKVALHPPSTTPNKGDGVPTDPVENTWILAVVVRCLSQEKNKYEVQDAEPQEDGQPGVIYMGNTKNMIPLPDPDASPSSEAHPNAYPEFPTGSAVLALYPDTSCFYRAEVIQGPKDTRTTPGVKQALYRLKFEDDDDQVHAVAAQWVVEWPRI